MSNFSKRFGFHDPEREITIREDAPEELRYALLSLAEDCGLRPNRMRSIACGILLRRPEPSNWSEYPNVWMEVENLIYEAPWYKVYDIAERFAKSLKETDFESKLNNVFSELGIGWQIIDGAITTRGPEPFEASVRDAAAVLEASGHPTALSELNEARRDLSRRPKPDLTGAIQHAEAALECVAREIAGTPKATLGDILKRYKDRLGIPAALILALEKQWGYASEVARHVREGLEPRRAEAELVVTTAGSIIVYLLNKKKAEDDPF